MKHLVTISILFFVLGLPLGALAMNHGGTGHDHAKPAKKNSHNHNHGAHADHGEMIVVGVATVAGVKAEAHLDDVEAAMKKAGMDATHHLMLMFMDVKTGKPITEGRAAVKVTAPDGTTGEALRLIGMEGHFGADIALRQKGEYTFDIGTRLPDGESRQFTFKHAVK